MIRAQFQYFHYFSLHNHGFHTFPPKNGVGNNSPSQGFSSDRVALEATRRKNGISTSRRWSPCSRPSTREHVETDKTIWQTYECIPAGPLVSVATSNVDHLSKVIIYLSYSQWFIFVAIPRFPFTQIPWHLPYMFHDISTHDGLIFSRLTEAADETGDGVLDREEFIQVQLVDVTSIILFYLLKYVGLCCLRKYDETIHIYIHIYIYIYTYICIYIYIYIYIVIYV